MASSGCQAQEVSQSHADHDDLAAVLKTVLMRYVVPQCYNYYIAFRTISV